MTIVQFLLFFRSFCFNLLKHLLGPVSKEEAGAWLSLFYLVMEYMGSLSTYYTANHIHPITTQLWNTLSAVWTHKTKEMQSWDKIQRYSPWLRSRMISALLQQLQQVTKLPPDEVAETFHCWGYLGSWKRVALLKTTAFPSGLWYLFELSFESFLWWANLASAGDIRTGLHLQCLILLACNKTPKHLWAVLQT